MAAPAKKATAYVLDGPTGTGSTEPVTFPGIPGVFVAGGDPQPLPEGADEGAIAALIAAGDLPLKKVTVAAEEALGVSSADLPSARPGALERSRSPMPGLSAEEFDARLAQARETGHASPSLALAARQADRIGKGRGKIDPATAETPVEADRPPAEEQPGVET